MDIRNKNPSLFRAFGFRPLVEKCSVRAAKSYIVACIDPLELLHSYPIYLSLFLSCYFSLSLYLPLFPRALFVCNPCVVSRSSISNLATNRISLSIGRAVVWENTVTKEYEFLSRSIFVCFRMFLAMSFLCNKKKWILQCSICLHSL